MPLSVFPLSRVPFLQVALHNYFYLYLSSPRAAATPRNPPHPFPRHPSTAIALSKSTRPLIHPGASRPPYRLREDIIIIACLLFPSLPLAPSIRPSSRPWWVRQSLRRWVMVVQRAGVGVAGGVGGGLQPAVPDSPEQRLRHKAPLLERLVRVRLLLTVCMCVPRHVSSALATICEQRCHRISQGYLGC